MTQAQFQAAARYWEEKDAASVKLDPAQLRSVAEAYIQANNTCALATGAAGSRQLDTLGEKILTGDDAPGFYLKHFVKDLGLAQDEARDSGLTLEVLGQALANCADNEGQGLGDRGTQA